MGWERIKRVPIWEINEEGLVRSIKTKKLKSSGLNDNGYLFVSHYMNTKTKKHLVHRLVADVFLQQPNSSGMQINHKDGNKENNHKNNLEWVTLYENLVHQMQVCQPKYRKILTMDEAKKILKRKYYSSKKYGWLGITAKHFNCSPQTVSKIWKTRSYCGVKLNLHRRD